MKQSVINQFNFLSSDDEDVLANMCKSGFDWNYFWNRAREKATAEGLLPESGSLVIEARYVNASESVVRDLMACCETAPSIRICTRACEPWKQDDVWNWICDVSNLSIIMFDAGVSAACTFAVKGAEDPLVRNGGLSLVGDVGILGLRNKAVGFIREIGGDGLVNVMGDIGDCACVHRYADDCLMRRVFAMSEFVRQDFVLRACQASFLAGATFVGKAAEVLEGRM